METKKEVFNFEQGLKRLEAIVKALERNNVTLEESIKLYQEGITLSKLCMQSLEEAEKKILILKEDEKGKVNFEEVPLNNNNTDDN